MNTNNNSNCPFDPNSCVFLDCFCSSWRKCENCSCKFLRLLNLEKDNKIEPFALSSCETDESTKSFEGRFDDLSSQLVSTQKLKVIESNIHFETKEFMIPDLTEAEIDAFFPTMMKRKFHL